MALHSAAVAKIDTAPGRSTATLSTPPCFSHEEARALRRLLDELELDFERDLLPLALGPNRDDSSAHGRGTSSPLSR